MKRRQFGAYLAAQRARITLLYEPGAIAVALGLALSCVVLVRFAYAPVLALFDDFSLTPRRGTSERRALREAQKLCGKESTGEFAGHYHAKPLPFDEAEYVEHDAPPTFQIRQDRIVTGSSNRQEWCLGRVLERSPGKLVAPATWRYGDGEDDVAPSHVLLEREGDVTLFKIWAWNMPRDTAHGDRRASPEINGLRSRFARCRFRENRCERGLRAAKSEPFFGSREAADSRLFTPEDLRTTHDGAANGPPGAIVHGAFPQPDAGRARVKARQQANTTEAPSWRGCCKHHRSRWTHRMPAY